MVVAAADREQGGRMSGRGGMEEGGRAGERGHRASSGKRWGAERGDGLTVRAWREEGGRVGECRWCARCVGAGQSGGWWRR